MQKGLKLNRISYYNSFSFRIQIYIEIILKYFIKSNLLIELANNLYNNYLPFFYAALIKKSFIIEYKNIAFNNKVNVIIGISIINSLNLWPWILQ